MKAIILTQGQRTMVDDADYDWLNQWKWYATANRVGGFYAGRKVPVPGGGYHHILMHRQILGLGRFDPRQGDHIHHNTLDNRRSEIRVCTPQENSLNRRIGLKRRTLKKQSNACRMDDLYIRRASRQVCLFDFRDYLPPFNRK